MKKPLKDIVVLDVTQYWAGPCCSMILADMGAEVIKIEPPGVGDGVRAWSMPGSKGESPHYLPVNRNKKSILLNLKLPKAKEIFLELAKQADIVLENFRPGVVKKLGIDYDAVKEVKPDIIYCSISGFGQTGPYSHNAAFDVVLQALGGLMSVTGEEGGRPVKPGAPQADVFGAMNAAMTILAMLIEREKTGEGGYLDIALLDSQIFLMGYHILTYLFSGQIPKPMGTKHPLLTPYESFQTKDIEIIIGVATERHWVKLCEILDKKELATDERFNNSSQRIKHREDLHPIIEKITLTRPGEYWLKALEENGIPCAAINTVDKLLEDPQVIHRNMIIEIENQAFGRVKVPGIPWKLGPISEEEPPVPPPLLGQHIMEILSERLGYSKEQVNKLKEEGVI